MLLSCQNALVSGRHVAQLSNALACSFSEPSENAREENDEGDASAWCARQDMLLSCPSILLTSGCSASEAFLRNAACSGVKRSCV